MTTQHIEPADTRCLRRFADGRRCALPAAPDSGGLCYPHAHAPHRRLTPSDLTRDLITMPGTLVPAHKIRRVLAKLPIAVADGIFSPSEAGLLTHLCNLMLGCNRQARKNPVLEPTPTGLGILVVKADANQNENNVQPSRSSASS